MTSLSRATYWAPRALGLLYAGLLALFALDVFAEGIRLAAFGAFAVHLLPAAVILVAVVIAWKYEFAGAALLTATGVWYSIIARDHPSWIVVIAGPLFVLAAMFVLSGKRRLRGSD